MNYPTDGEASMSVHAWVRKSLAAYVAGGLTAASRARLERHVARCAECESALAEARSVDDQLTALFADVRPGPALEEEAIRRLRQAPPLPGRRWLSRKVKAVLAVAAGVFLAVAGAGLSAPIAEDWPRFPGETASASTDRPHVALDSSGSMRGNDKWETGFGGETEKSHFGVRKQQESSASLKHPEELAQEFRENSFGFYAPATALVVRGP